MTPARQPPGTLVRPTRIRHWVVATLCATALIAYVQRNSIAVAEAEIRHSLDLNKQQMGWVISAFFLTYALFQLPTGYIGQRWGTRRGLAWFVSLFSAATGVFALSAGPWSLLTTRAAMGALQSGIFPCAVNSIARWLPDSGRSFASGLLGSFMSVGGAAGAALTGFLLPLLGWRGTHMLYSLPGLCFAAWFFRWFRERPEEHGAVNRAELELIRRSGPDAQPVLTMPAVDSSQDSTSSPSDRIPWRAMLTRKEVWGLCAQQLFRAAGYIFFASWFATYLRETREIEDWMVGLLTSLPLWGVVVGSPLGGALSDWLLLRTKNRRFSREGLAAAAMLACGLLVLAAYPIANAWLAVLLISAGSFCAAFGGPCAYAATIDMGGRHVVMLFSLMNMAGNVGAFLFPVVVPWLLNESELYIDKLAIGRASSGTTEQFEAEASPRTNARPVSKLGDTDETALRFHHSTPARRVLFAEFDVEIPAEGAQEIRIRYTGQHPPPLRVIAHDRLVSDNVLVTASGDPSDPAFHWVSFTVPAAPEGRTTWRLETETQASGNWSLVLLLFVGIYFAAATCWLLVNTNRQIV